MENLGNNLVALYVAKEVTRLYKNFLETVETIKSEHNHMKDQVAKHCAPEFAEDINYFNADKQARLRKVILDNGNETIRQINGYVDMFDFKINEEKVQQASKRVIVKKFTTSMPIQAVE